MATTTVLTNADKTTARSHVVFGSIRDFVGSVNLSGTIGGARVRVFATIDTVDHELDEIPQSMPLAYTCEGFGFEVDGGNSETSITVKLTEV